MKIVVPDYYKDFACIKGECRHSCCVGWEIDIDPDSLKRFYGVEGKLGERLRQNICEKDGEAFFRLTQDERCPFLNGEGLCDLILGLGEDCLCQICDDHPRFRNFFSDREEIGLGLCCEAAGRLILGRKAPVKLVLLEDDGTEEKADPDEQELLILRDELISMSQDRSLGMEARLLRMMDFLQIELKPFAKEDWIDFLLGLERLDESWAECLQAFKRAEHTHDPRHWETTFEQLLVYLIFRHLTVSNADDDLGGYIAYAAFVWELVRGICAAQEVLDFEGIVEICRLYSSELEYSDENIAAIIEHIHALNPEL